MKRLAGQINVTIHALGILLCLPRILETGERIVDASPWLSELAEGLIAYPSADEFSEEPSASSREASV